jgi:hypothetical protein
LGPIISFVYFRTLLNSKFAKNKLKLVLEITKQKTGNKIKVKQQKKKGKALTWPQPSRGSPSN